MTCVREEQYNLCIAFNYFVGNIVQIVCALICTILSPFKKVVCIAAFEVLLSSYIIILDVIKFSLYNYSGSIEVLSFFFFFFKEVHPYSILKVVR